MCMSCADSFLTGSPSSRGAQAHKSHKDPNDQEDVISLQFLDENENRIKSKHVHEDGTSK
jgi:hypothetical protein